MTNPIRIQRQLVKGWKMPENTVYVGRGTKWSNPFSRATQNGVDAQDAIRLYIEMMFPYRNHEEFNSIGHYLVGLINVGQIQLILRGKNLACWCALDRPCHADVLLKYANL